MLRRDQLRRSTPARASPALCLALLALVLCGCEKKTDVRSTTGPSNVSGASPEHYVGADSSTTKPMRFPRVPPATKPTQTLRPGTTCLTAECHASFANASQIHGPVSKGACNTCHEDDVGGHTFPLKQKGNASCTFCHATVVTGASFQHKAVELGCIKCHDPHASNAKFLLKRDNIEQTCAMCHNIPLKIHAHEPFAKGECSLCHFAHEADNKKLLRGGEGSKHCYTCHSDIRQAMTKDVHTHQPAMKDCKTCHDPHATDFDHQLRAPVEQTCLSCHKRIKEHIDQSPSAHGAMIAENSCSNCHDAHASMQSGLLRQRTDDLCLKCHDKPIAGKDGRTIASMKDVLTKSKYLHGPNKVGNCSACHDPHGSKLPNLLDRSFPDSFYTKFDINKYELCFNCHERQLVLTAKTQSLTNFRDGDRNLHFVHVNREDKGRSCRTCHDVHGSDLPKHMASSVPFEGSNWAMPIGYEQTPDGGRCAPGCHTPKEYRHVNLPSTLPTTVPTTQSMSSSKTAGVP